jgi:hypothetical protein
MLQPALRAPRVNIAATPGAQANNANRAKEAVRAPSIPPGFVNPLALVTMPARAAPMAMAYNCKVVMAAEAMFSWPLGAERNTRVRRLGQHKPTPSPTPNKGTIRQAI